VRLLGELKRRKVFRVLVVYTVVGWLVVQVTSVVAPALHLPPWTVTLLVVLVLAGLPLAVVLAWAFELTPDGVRRTEPRASGSPGADLDPEAPAAGGAPSQPRRRTSSILAGGVGVGILLGLVTFGGIAYLGGPRSDPGDRATVHHLIAVLAFDDLSPGQDQAWFADGIAEEIRSELTRVEGLRVSARESSFQFRGTRIDPRRIGDTLGVGNLLTGSVRTGGDSVWITPQLIDAATGFQLWSETYARVPSAQSLRAVQSEVAREVASTLALRFFPAPQVVQAEPTDEAYEHYLQGRSLLRRWQTGISRNPEEMLESIERFREVTALSPEWASGWAGLGEVLHWAASSGTGLEYLSTDARAALERALELDPNHAGANSSLAFVLHRFDGDLQAAEARYERAFEFDPDRAWHGYAMFLRTSERYDEAVGAFRRAEALDPLSLVIKEQLAWTYQCAGRYQDAVAAGERLLALGSSSVLAMRRLALALERTGRVEEAVALFEERGLEGTVHPDWVLLLARLGRAEEAEAHLRPLEEAWERVSPTLGPSFAAVLIRMGRTDAAVRIMEEALERHPQAMISHRCYPEMAELDGDGRYERLRRTAGLPHR
jgi:TolB-like protein/Tfp pilus assembly protein PilF